VSSAVATPAREPRRDLIGQTLLVIGGSSGIGLETGRLAGEKGADVIITARDPERLRRAGDELVAEIAAFDAMGLERLGRFFDDLPRPMDHVLVTGPGPYYAPLAKIDVDKARCHVGAHLLLPVQVGRHARGRSVREGRSS
jgi:NAD(P)-dependent dehydrogenase (short-subunit alcohol dehydrogenase family)